MARILSNHLFINLFCAILERIWTLLIHVRADAMRFKKIVSEANIVYHGIC